MYVHMKLLMNKGGIDRVMFNLNSRVRIDRVMFNLNSRVHAYVASVCAYVGLSNENIYFHKKGAFHI